MPPSLYLDTSLDLFLNLSIPLMLKSVDLSPALEEATSDDLSLSLSLRLERERSREELLTLRTLRHYSSGMSCPTLVCCLSCRTFPS